LSKKQLVDIA